MRAHEFIIEDISDAEKVVDLLDRNCRYYLGLVNGIENALWRHPMYRGVSHFRWGKNETIKKQSINQNRPPRDTAGNIHKLADQWFKERTGIPFRSASLFTSGDDNSAQTYSGSQGEVVIVCPIGKFDYCWSPYYYDMTAAIDKHYSDEAVSEIETVNRVLDIGDYVLNKRLPEAIQSGHEIMIHCLEAYLINIKVSYDLFKPAM